MTDSTQAPEAVSSRVLAFRWLLGHYALYALTNIVLLTINVLTTPGTWWFLWVVGAWGIFVAAHAGYFLRGFVGAHIATFASAALGMVIIDLVYSDKRWFYWPLLPWLFILGLHVLFASSLRRRYFAFEASLTQPPGSGPGSTGRS